MPTSSEGSEFCDVCALAVLLFQDIAVIPLVLVQIVVDAGVELLVRPEV